MTTPPIPNPGSDEALDEGCICPVLDNGHGRRPDLGYAGWVINAGCPLHDPKKAAANNLLVSQ